MAFDDLFGSVGTPDFYGALEAGINLAGNIWGGPGSGTGAALPPVFMQQPPPSGRPLPAVIAGTLGAGAVELASSFFGSNGDQAGLFRATAERVIPRARIDAVGPDGRCYTWFRAVPYGWKVRGTKVGGRKRHHHHYRRPR